MNVNISCFQKQEDEARAPQMLPANTSVCVALKWCLVCAPEGGEVQNRLRETSSDPSWESPLLRYGKQTAKLEVPGCHWGRRHGSPVRGLPSSRIADRDFVQRSTKSSLVVCRVFSLLPHFPCVFALSLNCIR